jgi:DNA-binding response OmpR family regulator
VEDLEGRAPVSGAARHRKILVVEAVRASCCSACWDDGYTVLTAPDGPAALDLLQRHPDPVHLIVASVGTPGVDPTCLADQVEAARPGARVLLLTGNLAGASDPRSGDTLAKPFAPAELLEKVRQVLDGARP